MSARDIAIVESGTVAVLGYEDLRKIIVFGKRWQTYAEALEHAGRWDLER